MTYQHVEDCPSCRRRVLRPSNGLCPLCGNPIPMRLAHAEGRPTAKETDGGRPASKQRKSSQALTRDAIALRGLMFLILAIHALIGFAALAPTGTVILYILNGNQESVSVDLNETQHFKLKPGQVARPGQYDSVRIRVTDATGGIIASAKAERTGAYILNIGKGYEVGVRPVEYGLGWKSKETPIEWQGPGLYKISGDFEQVIYGFSEEPPEKIVAKSKEKIMETRLKLEWKSNSGFACPAGATMPWLQVSLWLFAWRAILCLTWFPIIGKVLWARSHSIAFGVAITWCVLFWLSLGSFG